ncbi:hypothetical protein N657DRAFT_711514 [Parathielavia appendiculata]|uniref:Uncharacterized protein n=1 Tax=Parathielavia appendiculata TaxID=2587402 RepID=A0AAN6YZ34_9PEZI|nr:hypothetical protein N657DRAFT_711514 [Parathielavia appendiculata]
MIDKRLNEAMITIRNEDTLTFVEVTRKLDTRKADDSKPLKELRKEKPVRYLQLRPDPKGELRELDIERVQNAEALIIQATSKWREPMCGSSSYANSRSRRRELDKNWSRVARDR